MVRISKIGFRGWIFLLLVTLCLGGCTASMQAQSKFEIAEQLAAEEKFDESIEKYTEAIELDPGNKAFKLKLLSARTRAAAEHARKARLLAKEGQYNKAMNEYALAKRYDVGIDYVEQEITDLQNMVEAEKFAAEGAGFFEQGKLPLARKAIDKALQLDSQNARALAVQDLLSRQQNTVTMDGIELDMASSEPFTLSFKDVRIKDAFALVTKLSGINFIFDEKVRDDKINLYQEKATFAQAMELLLQMNGLEKKVLNSRTIIIYPQTREKEKQYDDQVIQAFYLSNIDAKKAVNMLRTMLQLRKVYVHEERNALVVRDKPHVIKLAEQILAAADRENSEVVLALELVSVSDADMIDLGTKLSTYSVSVGESKDGENLVSSGFPAGGSVGNAITSLNNLTTYFTLPSAVFEFAKTLTSTNILANPKIRVRNKEKAKVHVGTREPIVTTVTTDTSTASNVQYVDVGVKLDVEPSIQLDNSVETKVKLEVSQVINREQAGSESAPVTALTISTTNAETVLTLKDGEQTIIGGLFEQQDIKQKDTIPFIGDIPGLGALFSKYANEDRKREILLSITPYIVKRVNVPEADVATIWSGGEDNLKPGPNFGAFVQPLQSEVEAITPLPAPGALSGKLSKAVIEENIQEAATSKHPDGVEDVPENSGDTDTENPQPGSVDNPVTPSQEVPQNTAEPRAEDQAVQEPAPAQSMTETAESKSPSGLSTVAEVNFVGPKNVEKGKTFALDVQVKNVEHLFIAGLSINYDPAVLELVDVKEGNFLGQSGETIFSSFPNRESGQVIIGYKQKDGGKGGSGQGTLFNISFKAVNPGTSSLDFKSVNFLAPDGSRLQVESDAVKIEVH